MRYLIRSLYSILWITTIFGAIYLGGQRDRLLSKHHKTLNIFAWGDFFHEETLLEFERRTGIHVKVHCYGSNEELYVKLKATKGEGYDLIVPSDYAVKWLSNEGLLKPLDKKQIDIKTTFEPFLLKQNYDPQNTYSLPYSWEVYGIGVDQEHYAKKPIPHSLSYLFDPKIQSSSISMTPDPVEALSIASYLLYGPKERLNAEELREAKSLLVKQKSRVEAYADYRARYLIQTGNCPIALLRSSFVWQMARDGTDVEFLIPKEGLFTSIENIAIPATTEKLDEVYAFIRFIYEPKIIAKQMHSCPTYPAIQEALPLIDENPNYLKAREEALQNGNFIFFNHLIEENAIREMWVDIKSK